MSEADTETTLCVGVRSTRFVSCWLSVRRVSWISRCSSSSNWCLRWRHSSLLSPSVDRPSTT